MPGSADGLTGLLPTPTAGDATGVRPPRPGRTSHYLNRTITDLARGDAREGRGVEEAAPLIRAASSAPARFPVVASAPPPAHKWQTSSTHTGGRF